MNRILIIGGVNYMDVFSAIQTRRSIRKYSTRPVEDEKLNKVLEAARLAPSARNLQDWKFIVVRDEEIRSKLLDAVKGRDFIVKAPVIIVACSTEPEGIMACGQYKYTIDLSIAMSFIMLEAHEQGLGTCWIGNFDEQKVKEVLGIPERVRAAVVMPLGYPDESPDQRYRKSIDEIVCYDMYKE